jgi:hypothetical protein
MAKPVTGGLIGEVDSFEFHGGGMMTVYGLREPADWLAGKPVLIASASLRADKARRYFPTLEHVEPPPPALPFQTVHQVLGSFGKHALRRKLPQALDQAKFLTASKRALVITHLEFADAFRAALPGVAVLHHGDVAGDDSYGKAEIVIQFGGRFAEPKDIARRASAESGRIVPVALMADGTGVEFNCLAYADPAAQAVHRDIYDGDFTQGALGRGRGLNRTAANPLEIHIFGNVPLPVPVNSLKRWKPLNRLAKMVLERRAHVNAADMHRFHPSLFRSPAVAMQAKGRCGGEAEMIDKLHQLAAQMPEPWAKVTWQPVGQGYKARTSIVPSADVRAFRAEVRREFPAGIAAWTAEPFTAGARPLLMEDSEVSPPLLGTDPAPEWRPDG